MTRVSISDPEVRTNPHQCKVAYAHGLYLCLGVCNPGGIFSLLGYEPWMTDRALSAGHHCGSHGISVLNGLPTG